MEVCFVRHGQTAYNVRKEYQPADAPLTKHGVAQAHTAVDVIASWRPTHVVTSNMVRAQQTAEILVQQMDLPITTSSLFAELQRSPRLYGIRHMSIRSLWASLQFLYNPCAAHWNRDGGESHAAFLQRVYEARDFLETFPPDARVLVVSHGLFINTFMHAACGLSKISTLKMISILRDTKAFDNTSLTKLSFQPGVEAGVCSWTVVSFDEDTHVV